MFNVNRHSPQHPAKDPAKVPAKGAAKRAAERHPAQLGERLRSAREKKGISLRELARRLDVSASLISQIERAHVMPSVGTLFKIADVLDLRVDEVFRNGAFRGSAAPAAAPADGGSGPVQRRSGRKTIKLAGGVTWQRLTGEPDADVEFLYVIYDVGSESCREDELFRHGGREYGYLLSGRLGVKIGFETYELAAGDSVSFEAQTPHRLWNAGREPAVAIWAIYKRHSDRRSAAAAVQAPAKSLSGD